MPEASFKHLSAKQLPLGSGKKIRREHIFFAFKQIHGLTLMKNLEFSLSAVAIACGSALRLKSLVRMSFVCLKPYKISCGALS